MGNAGVPVVSAYSNLAQGIVNCELIKSRVFCYLHLGFALVCLRQRIKKINTFLFVFIHSGKIDLKFWVVEDCFTWNETLIYFNAMIN